MKRRGKAVKQRAKLARRVVAPKVRPARRPGKVRPSAAPDLRRERDAALEQLAATSAVLQAISRSSGELQPVFELILKNATRICEAKFGNLWLREGDKFRIVANYGGSRKYRDFQLSNSLTVPDPRTTMGRAIITRKAVQIEDIRNAPTYGMKAREATVKIAKARSLVAVPMLKDDEVIGVIGIYRQEVRPFTDKQVALLSTFAAQAVIAIENARLLSELRELLAQQTATADVLRVISSSPGAVDPVFEALLENATRLCEASYGNMWLSEGDAFRSVAFHGVLPTAYMQRFGSGALMRPDPELPIARAASTKQPFQIADIRASAPYLDGNPFFASAVDQGGILAVLAVPMLKENELVGAIVMYSTEARSFADKQIELVQNFAAQAVIAIENTRLLNELREF